MRLLIVEDEKKIADFLRESLEAEYFAVDVVEDGDKGAYYAQINEYDLIILDVLLPKKDGLEVLHELRAHASRRPVERHPATCIKQAVKFVPFGLCRRRSV